VRKYTPRASFVPFLINRLDSERPRSLVFSTVPTREASNTNRSLARDHGGAWGAEVI
jgi:hypothetical protein